MRWVTRSTAVAVAAATCLSGLAGLAKGADSAPKSFSVTVKFIDRDGRTATAGVDAGIAAPLFPGTPLAEYETSNRGVLTLQPGKWILGVSIPTPPGTSGGSYSSTLAARIITVSKNMTVTMDARPGKLVRLRLDPAIDYSERITQAGLCFGTGPAPVTIAAATAGAVNGQPDPALYAVPFRYKGLSFDYSGNWYDQARPALIGIGAATGGVPANPSFAFRVADLATLRLQARSGEIDGDAGFWRIFPAGGCEIGSLQAEQDIAVPSIVTLLVSAGHWRIAYSAVDRTGQTGTQFITSVQAGHSYLQSLEAAVVGPASWAIPGYLRNGANNLSMPLYGFFSDPHGGVAGRANGVLKLTSGGRTLRTLTLRNTDSGQFEARLPRAGWYDLTIHATRAKPEPGVTPAAALSTRVSVAWRFRASATDLRRRGFSIPVTVSHFAPSSLSIINDAVPGAVTPLRMTITRGRAGRAFRLKTVQLQFSVNGGAAWHSLRLNAHNGYWTASIPDPASGFVSLRSTVTDVRGDRTVQTVYRSYGVR